MFAGSGGEIRQSDIKAIVPDGEGWRVVLAGGGISARHVVVALGPWSADLLRPLGYRVPLAFERGYHQEFKPNPARSLQRPIHDAEGSFIMTPMEQGIRVTSGVELTARDAPSSFAQLDQVVPAARERCRIWRGGRRTLARGAADAARQLADDRTCATAFRSVAILWSPAHRLHDGPCNGSCDRSDDHGKRAILRRRAVFARAATSDGRQTANKRVAVSGSRHALHLGFRDPRQIQPPVLARARLDHRLHDSHRPARNRARLGRRHPSPEALARDRLASARLHRTVPLHTAVGSDHLVLLRLAGRHRREHPGTCRRRQRALALCRSILCRDRPWQHRERAPRTMGRGAGPGTGTMARAEARDPAAGAQADAGALRQPVGDAAEEHLAGVRHRRSRPRLQRDADQRRDLSAAGSVYDRGPDLLCDPVPGHACRAEVRAWPDLRQADGYLPRGPQGEVRTTPLERSIRY